MYIGARARLWLEKYVREGRPQFVSEPDDFTVFLTAQGEPFSRDHLSFTVKERIDAAKLGKTGSCHLFRHTMATLMHENGADLRFIQQMLGQEDIKTIPIYTQVAIRALQQIHAATHPECILYCSGSPDLRWTCVLTMLDQFTRECLCLHANSSLSGKKVAAALDKVIALRGAPESITVDHGTEFASKAMDLWAYTNGVYLDFICPGRPTENGYIESFNGKLRDEFLNVEVCFTLADAHRKLHRCRRDYNQHRPHSALADRTPAEFAATCSGGRGGDLVAFCALPPHGCGSNRAELR